jgi:hypothetical protein
MERRIVTIIGLGPDEATQSYIIIGKIITLVHSLKHRTLRSPPTGLIAKHVLGNDVGSSLPSFSFKHAYLHSSMLPRLRIVPITKRQH